MWGGKGKPSTRQKPFRWANVTISSAAIYLFATQLGINTRGELLSLTAFPKIVWLKIRTPPRILVTSHVLVRPQAAVRSPAHHKYRKGKLPVKNVLLYYGFPISTLPGAHSLSNFLGQPNKFCPKNVDTACRGVPHYSFDVFPDPM